MRKYLRTVCRRFGEKEKKGNDAVRGRETVSSAMPIKHKKLKPRRCADEQRIDGGEDCDQAKGEHQEGAFGVLPNELVLYILCQHVKPIWQVVCKSVCQRWHLLLLNQRLPLPDYTITLAKKGRLGVLQWARSQGCPWDERTCAIAAEGGHLEMLK